MRVRESGMPEQAYWESLIDACGLLEEMGLAACDSVFEFGVGYGTFLRCYAGGSTRIAGIDIDEAMVGAARERLRALGAAPVLCCGDFFDDDLPDRVGRFEVCLAMNILHHAAPADLLAAAGRLLSPGGRVGICHWRDDIETPRGPPPAMRIGLDRMPDLIGRAGFELLRAANSARSRYHYYAVALKK